LQRDKLVKLFSELQLDNVKSIVPQVDKNVKTENDIPIRPL